MINKASMLKLVSGFGVLLQQASIYGVDHKVSQTILEDVYREIFLSMKNDGKVELIQKGGRLLINGVDYNFERPLMRNLITKLVNNDIECVVFDNPITKQDVESFVRVLSMPSSNASKSTDVAELLQQYKVKRIHVTKPSISKEDTVCLNDIVDNDIANGGGNVHGAGNSHGIGNSSGGVGGHVAGAGARSGSIGVGGTGAGGGNGTGTGNGASAPKGQASNKQAFDFDRYNNTLAQRAAYAATSETQSIRSRRLKNSELLANMLRATATLIENEDKLPEGVGHRQILISVERILKALEESSSETRLAASRLAAQVEADRRIVESIEDAARKNGIGIKLTRKELIERYAELNQEILQPTTVAMGAVDMLLEDDKLSPTQKELLKLAAEGIERVNQLISYMTNITGLPEALNPDGVLIDEMYGKLKDK